MHSFISHEIFVEPVKSQLGAGVGYFFVQNAGPNLFLIYFQHVFKFFMENSEF